MPDIYVGARIGGINLIEVTALNYVIVAEDNSISREVLGDCGIHCEGDDDESLTECL